MSRIQPPAPSSVAKPRLAALFWFYKAFDVCFERIALLRRLNPSVPVFGLYGGPPEDVEAARCMLGAMLDDLYVYTVGDAEWRWIHGDQAIAAWHDERGSGLLWDSVVIVQWDMLLLAPLSELLGDLREGEAAFSGDRPLGEVSSWWGWGGAGGPKQNAVLADFEAFLISRYGYDGPLWCCLFIVAVLPRAFLDRYVAEGSPQPGFLEHKLPTLARVFDIPVRTVPAFAVWWRADPSSCEAPAHARVVNATGAAIDPAVIAAELVKPGGRRVFHPVFETPAFLAEGEVER